MDSQHLSLGLSIDLLHYTCPLSFWGILLISDSPPLNASLIPILQIEGEVTYNGLKKSDFVIERTCAYVDQVCDGWQSLTDDSVYRGPGVLTLK